MQLQATIFGPENTKDKTTKAFLDFYKEFGRLPTKEQKEVILLTLSEVRKRADAQPTAGQKAAKTRKARATAAKAVATRKANQKKGKK